jgi:hypothetical protein
VPPSESDSPEANPDAATTDRVLTPAV